MKARDQSEVRKSKIFYNTKYHISLLSYLILFAPLIAGAVNVPLDSIQANSEVETWLSLRLPGISPKPQPKNSSNKSEQLSVRVKVKYQV